MVVALVGLAAYNHLHHVGTYACLALTLGFVGCVMSLAAHAAAIWLTSRTSLLAALKGNLPAWPTLLAVYALRTVTALIAVTVVASALVTAGAARDAADGARLGQARAGDTAHILLNGSLGETDTESMLNTDVAAWLSAADLDGRIILASDASEDWQVSDAAGGLVSVVVVNPAYLRHQAVTDVTGLRLDAAALPTDRPTLLTPADRAAVREPVLAAATRDLEFARARSGAPRVPRPHEVTIAAGQNLFLYGSALAPGAVQTQDAVLLVVPPEMNLWGRGYVEMAENLVLTEPGLPDDVAADPRLSTAFLSPMSLTQFDLVGVVTDVPLGPGPMPPGPDDPEQGLDRPGDRGPRPRQPRAAGGLREVLR